MRILITGGAGFIGSALVRYLIAETDAEILNFDKLTYAGNLHSLGGAALSERYKFFEADIAEPTQVQQAFDQFQPDAVMHLAAESHVDRSIDSAAEFIRTNISGTYTLLDAARKYWEHLSPEKQEKFRFLHVSTDEVYGDLAGTKLLFTEETKYQPSSPYAASKASSDHLVRAWSRTYGLPVIVTNCSNNYGPYQFPEKLIPHMILSALDRKPLPVYGNGQQIRDWLFVEDHVRALWLVLKQGQVGSTYNIGGHNEVQNIEVVTKICDLVAELTRSDEDLCRLISYVTDRPGHDARYAIDASKIEQELGWVPLQDFDTGLRKTVEWYLHNRDWWSQVLDGSYRLTRLGNANAG